MSAEVLASAPVELGAVRGGVGPRLKGLLTSAESEFLR